MIRQTTGIVEDIGSLASNGIRAVRTRLELLSIELMEEKAWVVRYLIVASAALYLLSFGTLLAILALALAMPESSRPAVLAVLGVLFILVGAGGVTWLVNSTRNRNSTFKETIGVLARDEKALRATGD